jgi:serine/threonine-protein phosphatase 6 regulatory ankyrin repeat subunit B
LLNEQDSDGNTAIAHALLADVPLKIVRMLIAAGADLSIGNKNGSPPLSLVKSAETARALIDAGADCNQQSNIGWTPLAVACHGGLVDVATMLLTRSASIDISTNGGVTSLMLAAHQGHLAVVELMLLARSPTLLNARTQDGATALHIAVQKDFLRVVDVLLSAGADPNIADNSGSSPLIKAHRTEIARRLLDGGADVNAHSLAGRTALMIAARSDSSASLVALLLQRRADVAAADNNGYNSLMWAACKNHVDVMSLLLQAPGVPEAWVNAQAHDGSTTLTVASEHGATAAVKALIAAGADVHLATNAGCTALHLAGNVDIARLLWNAGAQDVPTNNGDSTLTYAVSWNKPDVVKFLLQCGLDVNEIHRNMTPMMRATACGHLDVLRVLLAADPPAEVDQHDEEGHTALFIAAQSKEPLAVKELLHAGASPRAASTAGTIPLMYCATPEAVKMLVDAAPGLINHTCSRGRGVLAYLTSKATLDELFASSARYNIQIDVDHADVKGDTALHMAMLSSSGPEAVKLLLEKGADVFSVGYGGMTVLMKPFLTDDVDVIEREYADLDLPDDSQGSTIADSTISDCLKAMLDHVVALEVGVESAPVRSTAKRGNHAAEIEGGLGNEQAAKRQRR